MQARERLYLTADKDRVVREGDPKAAFLYAALGDEIPTSAAEKFGLIDGLLKTKGSRVTPVDTTITHLARKWIIRLQDGAFFVIDDAGANTGPYGTAQEAEQWVRAIAPAATEKPETPPTPKPEAPPTPKPEKKPAAKKAAARKKAA